MGITKTLPSSDLRRIAGAVEFMIHSTIIVIFLLFGYWLIVKSGFNVILGLLILVVCLYFVGAAIFWITRTVFRVIDKKLETIIAEEMNVSIEEIPKKEKRKISIPKILKKKEVPVVDAEDRVIGTNVSSGGTIPLETEELAT